MILDTVYALAIIFIVIPSILINFVMGLTLYKVREILNELRQEAGRGRSQSDTRRKNMRQQIRNESRPNR